ncbi:hypothetical protein [Bounagaea algeriensis]
MNKRGTAGAVIGWGLYAVGVVIWLYVVPLAVASKIGSSTVSIENEMIVFAGVGFALISGVGLAILTAKLHDRSKATKIARYVFLALAVIAVVGWFIPAMS